MTNFKIGDVLTEVRDLLIALGKSGEFFVSDRNGVIFGIPKGYSQPVYWDDPRWLGFNILTSRGPWTIVADPSKPEPEPFKLTDEHIGKVFHGHRYVIHCPMGLKWQVGDYDEEMIALLALDFAERRGWQVEEVREDG